MANSDTSVIVDQTLFADGSSSTIEAVLYTFTTTNYGKFSVTISAAAYDSTNKVMAGIDSINNRLHILTLSDSELDDDDTTAYGQRLSVATTGVASSDATSSDYEVLTDLLSNPSVVSFSPTSRLFVVDSTSTNDYIKVLMFMEYLCIILHSQTVHIAF